MTFTTDRKRRAVEFDIRLSPIEGPVVFGDTKEGTFAIRMHPQLRLEGPVATATARNSEGVEGRDVWGKRARWIAYSGSVEGEAVTVVMMDHPSNLRHPTWWHARDYGLCAANPFGARAFEGKQGDSGDFTLEADGQLRMRYRILLMPGGIDVATIEADFASFAP